MQSFDQVVPEAKNYPDRIARNRALGAIAVAEKRYDAAIAAFRAADIGSCVRCALPDIARVYDLAGQADSAIAVYERFLATPSYSRLNPDDTQLGSALKRLGELHEARGNRAKAMEHYAAFIELWKGADPELQPAVTQARQRLANLQRAGGD